MDLIGLELITWPNWYTWVTLGFISLIINSLLPSKFFLGGGVSAFNTGILTGLGLLTTNFYQSVSFIVGGIMLYFLFKIFWSR